MKNIPFWTFTVMALIGLGGRPVLAAEPEQPPTFLEVDKDKSGYITIDESMVVPNLAQDLPRLDKDEDGKLSEEEYEALSGVVPEAGGITPKTPMD